jgi:hypothetical protein
LEFPREANEGVDGEALVDNLLSLLAGALPLRLGVALDRSRVVELDSTTAVKFSRHLIVHLPNGAAFHCATACGAFVHAFWQEDVLLRRDSDPRASSLFVRKSKEDSTSDSPFVDLGVYTRNRAFRLYLCSKHGKGARLLPTRRCWESLHAAAIAPSLPEAGEAALELPQEWLFLAALICNVGSDAQLIGSLGHMAIRLPHQHTRNI